MKNKYKVSVMLTSEKRRPCLSSGRVLLPERRVCGAVGEQGPGTQHAFCCRRPATCSLPCPWPSVGGRLLEGTLASVTPSPYLRG